jgi:hypothetical protein
MEIFFITPPFRAEINALYKPGFSPDLTIDHG